MLMFKKKNPTEADWYLEIEDQSTQRKIPESSKYF